jgi:hypothetical protein
MKPRDHDPISTAWTDSNVALVSRRLLRAEFLSNPPHIQAQRRERVRQLLLAEAQRNQKSHSYLWQHAKEIYG